MRVPEASVGGEPVVELDERLWPDAVQAALRVRARLDEAGLLQDAEMLGHRRLAEAEPVDELADRPLPIAKEVEDLEPARLGENLECRRVRHANQYC